jgi:hypothetical protein
MGQEREPRLTEQEDSQGQSANKKAYQKPAFRYEHVFETMALACGKTNNGVPSCHKLGTKAS